MLEADIVGIGKWLNSRRLSGYSIDFFFFFSYIRNSCYRANDGIPMAPNPPSPLKRGSARGGNWLIVNSLGFLCPREFL